MKQRLMCRPQVQLGDTMVLAMSRPFKHPETGVYYFRKAVPADLRSVLGRTEVRRSLGTKDPNIARERFGAIAAQIAREWQTHRAQPESLQHKQIVALAGIIYRELAGASVDEPGPSEVWEHVQRLHWEAREKGKLDVWLGPLVDKVLLESGVKTDLASKAKLIEEADKALLQAAELRHRQSKGDYRPDTEANRFPEFAPASAPKAHVVQRNTANSLSRIATDWWREAKALGRSPNTYAAYSKTIENLIAFLGHEDALKVTPEDVIAFKDHRLSQINPRSGKPLSAKTVKDGDLAALRAVFDWAVTNRRMIVNPAKDVTLRVARRQRLRDSNFTDSEAKALLSLAARYQRGRDRAQTAAAKRWVPWLAAYTGARVGELGQLRKEDIRVIDGGTVVIRITPEAGTVKTNEAREVPLHPHLVEQGFLDFVKSSKSGHLFITVGRDGDPLGPLQGLVNRLVEFARQVIKDPNVQPNHGWRHRFKTIARDVGMDAGVRDAIQGHASSSVAESYGSVSMRAKVAAIGKMPRYEI